MWQKYVIRSRNFYSVTLDSSLGVRGQVIYTFGVLKGESSLSKYISGW
jgi:hypothetical protein